MCTGAALTRIFKVNDNLAHFSLPIYLSQFGGSLALQVHGIDVEHGQQKFARFYSSGLCRWMERRELELATRFRDHSCVEGGCACDHFEDIYWDGSLAHIVMKEIARGYRLGFRIWTSPRR